MPPLGRAGSTSSNGSRLSRASRVKREKYRKDLEASGGAGDRAGRSSAETKTPEFVQETRPPSFVRSLNDNPKALLLFDEQSFLRTQCSALVKSKAFNDIILVSIVANCLLMAVLYDPLDVKKYKDIRDATDIFFTFLFMFEMFAKIIAYGLYFGQDTYLKNGWNVLDGIVVLVSFICLEFVGGGIEGLASVRAIRGIRPLRTLSKFKSGALFVNTIFSSWNLVCNVIIFLIWFIILAACAGTVLFNGQLRSRCYDLGAAAIAAAGGDASAATCPSGDELLASYTPTLDDTGESIICGSRGCPAGNTCCFNGKNPGDGYYSFDNVLWASLVVLQGLTVDGWNEVCYLLMDALGWPVLLWFALVVFFGAFFVMQLLSAVIVTSLQTCSQQQQVLDEIEKEEEQRREKRKAAHADEGDDTVTKLSADAMMLNAISNFFASPALEPLRRVLHLHIPQVYELANSDGFNNCILICIVINTIAMMCRHFPESEDFRFAMSIINFIFTIIFIVEFVIKHLGLGLAGYWSVDWNKLDGIVVISSLFDLAGSAVNLGFLRSLRVLRVVRTVRVLKVAPEAMAVMNSMFQSLKNMGGFLVVWFIFMLIYALLGTRIFGGKCIFELDQDAGRLSFNSFTRALLTLFVTASGEDAFDVMHWTMEATEDSSSIFMISWMFISQIILALLLALLIDSYSVEDEGEEEENVPKEKEMGKLDSERYDINTEDASVLSRSASMAESSPPQHNLDMSQVQHPRDLGSESSAYMDRNSQAPSSLNQLLEETHGLERRVAPKANLMLQLKQHRTMHEVAVIRQWLYDIDFDTEKLVLNAMPLPIRMTKDQEDQAKDRLSVKKHYKNDASRKRFKDVVFNPYDNGSPGRLTDENAKGGILKNTERGKEINAEESNALPEKSLWVRITEDDRFANTILFAILASSVMLALETPTWPKENTMAGDAFFGIDICFTIVFTIEMVVQFLAIGVFGYLRSAANQLDFAIVFTAWLSILITLFAKGVDPSSLAALRSFRLLRVLRPLRAVRRLPSLRMVVDCTLGALPAIKWIMVLGVFLAIILGLFGMELYGGKMWGCILADGVVEKFTSYTTEATCVAAGGVYGNRTLTHCENESLAKEIGEPFASATSPMTVIECTMPEIVTKADCRAYNGTWANQVYNFDSIGESLITVFISSTADNWQDIMYSGIDTVGVDKNPKYDNALEKSLYFVMVTMLSCFFWANMFVSTLVDQYTKASENEGVLSLEQGSPTMSKAIQLMRQQYNDALHWANRKVDNAFTAWCIKVGSNPLFQVVMLGVIVINGIVLMMTHADQPAWMNLLDFVASITFQVIYCIEVIIMMVAMRPRAYFMDPWNRFDFFIVLAGLLELCIPGDHGFVTVLRTFRFLRLFKVVKGLKELRTLLFTIINSMPGVSNIGVLLFLLMFMYACLGVTLYGEIGEPYGYPDGLNKYTNFHSWPNAMLTLFVIFTGNWESIFRSTYWDCEGGPEDWGRECKYRISAPFYFFSYFLFANCVLGNLFVSIILDKFTATTMSEDAEEGVDFTQVVHKAFLLQQFSRMVSRKVQVFQMLTGRVKGKKLEHHKKLYRGLVGDNACKQVVTMDEGRNLLWDLRGIRKYFDTMDKNQDHKYVDESTRGSPRSALDLEGTSNGSDDGDRPKSPESAEVTKFRAYNVVHESQLRAEDGHARFDKRQKDDGSGSDSSSRRSSRGRGKEKDGEGRRRAKPLAIPEDDDSDGTQVNDGDSWFSFGCQWIPGADICSGTTAPPSPTRGNTRKE